MFERSLQDLIRGLRAHKASPKSQEDVFVAEVVAEIRRELRGNDMALKAEGIVKMSYLMMLYPIPPPPSFAFHVVEVMSSPRYHLKQLGYFAAPVAFTGDSEEIVLTVNSIKKDMLAPHSSLPPLPLNTLTHLIKLKPSLSHTFNADLLHLLNHSSARIRKRAVLCLLPCWTAFPDGALEGYARLREKLTDEDSGVVGATVGVVMELARRHGGERYLPLAPQLFGILTGSNNNWMLIKVVKLFAILTPIEPRLVRKLLPPITSLISSTSAISLLYECVRTCIVGGMLDPDRVEGEALARVCVEKLGGYLRDEGGDQNLRYIALLAMVKIIPTYPQMIADYQEEILQSLEDEDVSIRIRALDLVSQMIESDNVKLMVDRLMTHLAKHGAPLPSAWRSLVAVGNSDTRRTFDNSAKSSQAYRGLVARRVLAILRKDGYERVVDYEWAISVIVSISSLGITEIDQEVGVDILEITAQYPQVRPQAVILFESLLQDRALFKANQMALCGAVVWLVGENATNLRDPESTANLIACSVNEATPQPLALSAATATAKIVGFYAAGVTGSWSRSVQHVIENLVEQTLHNLAPLASNPGVDVQQRYHEIVQLLSFVRADLRAYTVGDVQGDPPYPKSMFLLQPMFTPDSTAMGSGVRKHVSPIQPFDILNEIVSDVSSHHLAPLAEDRLVPHASSSRVVNDVSPNMMVLRRILEEHGSNRQGRKKRRKSKTRITAGSVVSDIDIGGIPIVHLTSLDEDDMKNLDRVIDVEGPIAQSSPSAASNDAHLHHLPTSNSSAGASLHDANEEVQVVQVTRRKKKGRR